MAAVEYRRHIPKDAAEVATPRPTKLEVGSLSIEPFHQTEDFPVNNPWSTFFRETLHTLDKKGLTGNGPVTELGVGDLRNRFAFNGIKSFTGIDLEPERLDLALVNQAEHDVPGVELYQGDAVAFIKSRDTWEGTIVACLPQTLPAPDDENKAVGTVNHDNPHLAPWEKWSESGLQLVAASLGELSQRAEDEARAVFLISGRVPAHLREQMIDETGWDIADVVSTPEPVQQSREISVAYARQFDDETELFYEKTGEGSFAPIDPNTAEDRRHQSFVEQTDPNVYHHLHAYVLEPKKERVKAVYAK